MPHTMTNSLPELNIERYQGLGLADVAERVLVGQRLSIDDGLRLFACPDVTAVGALAHFARVRLHGLDTHFVVNRHLNYSNVCVNRCRFCAFRRDEGQHGAFTFSMDELLAKLDELPGTAGEIHIVGSCHPELPLSFFEELLRRVAQARPLACIKAFTAVEIEHLARLEGIPPRAALARLQAAGLCMLAGGGAEIFSPEVRARICPEKLPAAQWLDIHRQAHSLGIQTNCTMLFGVGEEYRHRLEHLDMLRRLQDETGGLVCCIPLPFQAKANELASCAGQGGESSPGLTGPTGLDELKTTAVIRLMLDNIPHIKAYWVMLGVLQAQAALYFGADDLDGTVVEEKIGHMAGAQSEQALSRAELRAMISACGLHPVERDGLFRPHVPGNGEAAA